MLDRVTAPSRPGQQNLRIWHEPTRTWESAEFAASRRIICHSVGTRSEVITALVFPANRESLACASRQAARSSLLVKTPSGGPSPSW
jgi:hypothetical protein